MIELERLSLTVDRKSGEPLEILRDVTLEIGQGEFVCVVGPSGCGKSTILNAVAGISLAGRWSGGVRVYGEESRTFDSRIGYMVQHDTLLPWRTARENVALGGQLSGRSGVDADKLLAQVGLGGFEKSYPHQLSGGMRKRAQLARILAQNTSTILMDEPFGALDYLTKIEMQQLLLQQVGEEKSVLFVTHDLTEAITLADRIIVIGPRPGTVVDVVPVNLPRPRRHDEVIDDPQFRILYDRLWSQLKH
ncbi:ABC transporter ATP-binding protein [Sinosporangium album]|uniref:ABC transporter ATP-binding protein n=1 Tax=Sinosporangium album TaxID=504805 RepID=UPI001C409884|nr:ABC transporter ATP-binding protein [Sinosporangium album]